MAKAVQKRTLETRARLLQAAEDIVGSHGFSALRVEEVVLRAGTAKGTFFAHFKDKDALMELIIGARLAQILDHMEAQTPPQTVDEFVAALMPICEFMTCERYVFDLILRYSGAAAIEEVGPIAETFGRQVDVFQSWLETSNFRPDISAELAAEVLPGEGAQDVGGAVIQGEESHRSLVVVGRAVEERGAIGCHWRRLDTVVEFVVVHVLAEGEITLRIATGVTDDIGVFLHYVIR